MNEYTVLLASKQKAQFVRLRASNFVSCLRYVPLPVQRYIHFDICTYIYGTGTWVYTVWYICMLAFFWPACVCTYAHKETYVCTLAAGTYICTGRPLATKYVRYIICIYIISYISLSHVISHMYIPTVFGYVDSCIKCMYHILCIIHMGYDTYIVANTFSESGEPLPGNRTVTLP
jgi:hypothetical protein